MFILSLYFFGSSRGPQQQCSNDQVTGGIAEVPIVVTLMVQSPPIIFKANGPTFPCQHCSFLLKSDRSNPLQLMRRSPANNYRPWRGFSMTTSICSPSSRVTSRLSKTVSCRLIKISFFSGCIHHFNQHLSSFYLSLNIIFLL